jgi:D-glycero-D-manno-heptose 1,7-bisphosphate phosphatase
LPGITKPVAFLDRDGTLIEDVGYPRDPAEVRLLPGALDALQELRRQGFSLAVVSNQSGIGRGLISPSEAREVHERFVDLLAAGGVAMDAVEYCPHAPWDGCPCRKPGTLMLERVAAALDARPEDSVLIGDKPSDIEAGRRLGLLTVLLAPPGSEPHGADRIAADWAGVLDGLRAAGAAR